MASTFIHALITANRLDRPGIEKWLFFPGMLFGSRRSWWGIGKPRPFSHEGVDVCLFETVGQKRFRLDASTRVPAPRPGTIVSIIDDFIGKTIVWEPDCCLQEGFPVYVLYAHVKPVNDLGAGDRVSAGETLARIARADPDRTPLPPHLHLSVVMKKAIPFPDRLDWPYLNRLDRSAFLDPLPLAGIHGPDMRVVDYAPGTGVCKDYPAVSRAGFECSASNSP